MADFLFEFLTERDSYEEHHLAATSSPDSAWMYSPYGSPSPSFSSSPALTFASSPSTSPSPYSASQFLPAPDYGLSFEYQPGPSYQTPEDDRTDECNGLKFDDIVHPSLFVDLGCDEPYHVPTHAAQSRAEPRSPLLLTDQSFTGLLPGLPVLDPFPAAPSVSSMLTRAPYPPPSYPPPSYPPPSYPPPSYPPPSYPLSSVAHSSPPVTHPSPAPSRSGRPSRPRRLLPRRSPARSALFEPLSAHPLHARTYAPPVASSYVAATQVPAYPMRQTSPWAQGSLPGPTMAPTVNPVTAFPRVAAADDDVARDRSLSPSSSTDAESVASSSSSLVCAYSPEMVVRADSGEAVSSGRSTSMPPPPTASSSTGPPAGCKRKRSASDADTTDANVGVVKRSRPRSGNPATVTCECGMEYKDDPRTRKKHEISQRHCAYVGKKCEKEFKCPHCLWAFNQQYPLDRHLLTWKRDQACPKVQPRPE
ncbi:hypothetical protein OBBRIDRAFT_833722 [Obba rivulosa]|uniref:Uncharacterized protein n=1 Tax=Obba rivulosa TaxID=1052685 RepID=A0A8E2DN60_9APHY|nr:hypothetical protein OBBRIDRAFT_833722 [Obba rivulosa]